MVSEPACPQAAAHVSALAGALEVLGHDVVVHTRRGRTDLGRFAKSLTARWRAERPDVVHAHFWTSGLAAVVAAKDLRLPVVQTYHALGRESRERRAVERHVGRQAALIAASSAAELETLVRMGVPRSRTAVVSSGVDTSMFHPEDVVRGGGRRIVSVGELVPRKGFADLVSALQRVPDAQLTIVGGPARRRLTADAGARRLRDQADAAGVAKRVRLTGHVPWQEMPDLLRAADVVACVPWHRPFGTVSLEAMACGVAVVASAVGGLADTVVDGVTGRLVPPHDPRALAKVLRLLLDDDSRRNAYGAAGADRVAARYTWREVARRTEELYERVG